VEPPAFYDTREASPFRDATYIDTLTYLEYINGQGLAQAVPGRVIHRNFSQKGTRLPAAFFKMPL
jgi:hypothetical protein